MSLLCCDHVSLQYEKQLAVEDVSFTLEEGDYLCIVGENGTGKSTLAKGILGLLKPVSGEITFHGMKGTEVGYLPQQTRSQEQFPASVEEVVLSGCLNQLGFRPFYSKEMKQRAREHMEWVGISDLAKVPFSKLSGGQQQRVLLARALLAARKLLLLDEPITGLDPVATAEFYQLIRRLNQEEHKTIIMVSHDIQVATAQANKILHLNTHLEFFGTTEAYRQTEAYHRMQGGHRHD